MADRTVRCHGRAVRRRSVQRGEHSGHDLNLFDGTFDGSSDFYTLTLPATITLSRNWYVLSDDNANGEASSQEYLTYTTASPSTTSVVPEPSTYALMGADMLALVVAARRRQVA